MNNLDILLKSASLKITASFVLAVFSLTAHAQSIQAAWNDIVQQAKGQTVYFNAWGGAENINQYIAWIGQQVKKEFDVNLVHVKIADAADVVKRVRTEVQAGKQDGSVDLVWINGENFAAMKSQNLLFGPFTQAIPNFKLVDVVGKPTTTSDFSVPTQGYESPWGMAQLTFMANRQKLKQLPNSMAELLTLAQQQPGQLTYPKLPNFHGTTFVKQVLLETSTHAQVLFQPYKPENFNLATAGLWQYLDQLHPYLWRSGKQFPNTAQLQRQMMADGELLLALTFNPNEAANEILANRLPNTVVSWQFTKGTIGNTHFVAIPLNAKAKAGAQVVANYLLSPLAQARKADIQVWGDPTVLDLSKLSNAEQRLMAGQKHPGQLLSTVPTLPEPHASWVEPIEQAWIKRYGVQ